MLQDVFLFLQDYSLVELIIGLLIFVGFIILSNKILENVGVKKLLVRILLIIGFVIIGVIGLAILAIISMLLFYPD